MKNILVVDDSSATRGALRRILEPMGFAVHEAANGALALESCERNRGFCAILLDIDMPVMDGFTFLSELRSSEKPHPPVVMCSSHSSLPDIQRALQAGADEYIMKPFDAEILDAKLAGIGVM